MRKISKGLAVAATVMAIGGTSLVAAAQTDGPGYGPIGNAPCGYGSVGYMHGWGGYGMMGGWGGYGPMGGQAAYGYADPAGQLDALKTALALRPEQTGAWDAYAKTVQDGVRQLRVIRDGVDFGKLRTMSWQDHWAYMGQLHDKQAAVFHSIQVARDSLLAVLDNAQKSRLLSAGPGYYGPRPMGWYGRGPMAGPGYGMMWGWGGGYR